MKPNHLFGLVFAGGKSTRMGEDKGQIQYLYGIEHRILMARLLAKYCDTVYISCREDQMKDDFQEFSPLVDSVASVGPISGLFSAFLKHKEMAWLTLPCDLPLFSNNNMEQLLMARNKAKLATVFKSACGKHIEPLTAVWETQAFPILETHFKKGKFSLSQILKKNQIELVTPFDALGLTNVNTPVEKRAVLLEHPSVQF